MSDWLRLKGVTSVGKPLITDMILDNIKEFYDWALLETGAFFNVRISTSGTYGGDKSKLRPVKDPRSTDGKIWEGFHNNWIWESGTSYAQSPISISGVYVNDVFYPSSTTGAYAHKINYRDGQIIFDSPISTTATVKAEFSYRWINIVRANSEFFKYVFQDSDAVDNSQFNVAASGHWNILNVNRVYLPTIAISTGESFELEPMQLGGGQWLNQNATFYVIADNEKTVNQLTDIIKYQNDRTIRFYDKSLSTPPLKHDGTLGNSPKIYPDLVADKPAGYHNKAVFIKNTSGNELGSMNNKLFMSTITCDLVIPMEEL